MVAMRSFCFNVSQNIGWYDNWHGHRSGRSRGALWCWQLRRGPGITGKRARRTQQAGMA